MGTLTAREVAAGNKGGERETMKSRPQTHKAQQSGSVSEGVFDSISAVPA